MIGPKDLREELWPTPLGLVKFGFQGLFVDFVHSFDLAIRLGVDWRGETKTNLEVGAKLLEFYVVKLPIVVCYNCMGYTEAT